MEKTQFNKFITENSGRIIHIICDNMMHFWINAKDSYFGWEDSGELCICIRPKDPVQTVDSSEKIWEAIQFRYDEIQYMESYLSTEEALTMVSNWSSMFEHNESVLKTSDDVKKEIMKSGMNSVYSARGYLKNMDAEQLKGYYDSGIKSMPATMEEE